MKKNKTAYVDEKIKDSGKCRKQKENILDKPTNRKSDNRAWPRDNREKN